MPLSLSMDGFASIIRSLDDMLKQIEALPLEMYNQTEDWQTQDVHFKRPYTKMVDAHTVETIVWPRGRRRQAGYQGRAHRGRRARKVQRLSAKPTRKYVRKKVRRSRLIASQRPLLRPFLYDMLVDRMNRVLETVKWH